MPDGCAIEESQSAGEQSPSLPGSMILLMNCPASSAKQGALSAVSQMIALHDGNVLQFDVHQDDTLNVFLARLEWNIDGFQLSLAEFEMLFRPLAKRFQMEFRVVSSMHRPRVAILVSSQDHCLADLLYRHRTGELVCDIPVIISNHETAQSLASYHSIPFCSVAGKSKSGAEEEILRWIELKSIDLIVLARYMQILSPSFVDRFQWRIINIHHSFLPAFIGAKPYHQAFARGVKLVGVTSHYVTNMLDEGPIIEQDVIRITHRDRVEDLIKKGRDLERVVLSRAVRWHLENRILPYGSKTVVF